MPKFGDYSASTAPNQGDLLLIKDINTNSTKKITRSNLLVGTALPTNTVTTAAITDASVTSAKVSGINKSLLTVDSNPYKFSATSNTQLTSGNGAFSGALVIEDEEYDTNSNYNAATGVYTAPVAGFYTFKAQLHFDSSSNEIFIALFKNGAEFRRGSRGKANAAIISSSISTDIQLAASDTVDVRAFGNNNTTDENTVNNFFQGKLFCRT